MNRLFLSVAAAAAAAATVATFQVGTPSLVEADWQLLGSDFFLKLVKVVVCAWHRRFLQDQRLSLSSNAIEHDHFARGVR